MGRNVLQFLVSFEARRRRVCAYCKTSFILDRHCHDKDFNVLVVFNLDILSFRRVHIN